MDPIRERNVFLLRWNPAISSFKMSDYIDATNEYPDGFGMNWSVYEWEDAHMMDAYFMMRVGEGETGLVWNGDFESEPYEGDDWAGKGTPRHYVDISCINCADPNGRPIVTTQQLQDAIPEIDWLHGHSGQRLDESVYERLMQLWVNSIVDKD